MDLKMLTEDLLKYKEYHTKGVEYFNKMESSVGEITELSDGIGAFIAEQFETGCDIGDMEISIIRNYFEEMRSGAISIEFEIAMDRAQDIDDLGKFIEVLEQWFQEKLMYDAVLDIFIESSVVYVNIQI